MARLASLLCGLLAAFALMPVAAADAPAGRWGVHGMALFGGREGLYASHLPMFHAPHDVQAVLQVHVADPAIEAELRRRLGGSVALWTVAPQRFDLDRLAPGHPDPLVRFTADLVQGHFERDGKTVYAGAEIVVDKVLYFQPLDGRARAPALTRYLSVGSGSERFLVKRIEARPDFDHIVALSTSPEHAAAMLTLPAAGLGQPPTSALQRAMAAAYGRGTRLRGTVYFETEDLK